VFDVLARGTDILAKAVAEHSAVPAFATYTLEMVLAVVPRRRSRPAGR
jgi:hypothetical protein